MLKVFSLGLVANLLYVLSGVGKQYVMAAQLSVSDFGTYGTWLTQASLLLVLLPFPAYLQAMIGGFSTGEGADARRGLLSLALTRELRWLAAGATGVALMALAAAWLSDGSAPARTVLAWAFLLLVQYIGATVDIGLRMYQAHRRIAAFMALRNLPSILLILLAGIDSPLSIAIVELISIAIVALGIRCWGDSIGASVAKGAVAGIADIPLLSVNREARTLWLARLVQYANSALLRLIVPVAFGLHETGLFFFACVAQIPCSLFLSITTQLFGHRLAEIGKGDQRHFFRIQWWFLAPNLLYALAMSGIVVYWDLLIGQVPDLLKYRDAGPVVLAVVVYSAVLSSDCQEYLLRTRGLSSVLLRYSAVAMACQLAVLLGAWAYQLTLPQTVYACAAVCAGVLALFTTYSFRLVVGLPRGA